MKNIFHLSIAVLWLLPAVLITLFGKQFSFEQPVWAWDITYTSNLKTGVSRKQNLPNFRRRNISNVLIRTRICAYQGVRNVRFSENLTCFIFLKDLFWDSPFCLITDELPPLKKTLGEISGFVNVYFGKYKVFCWINL